MLENYIFDLTGKEFLHQKTLEDETKINTTNIID